MQSRRQVRLVNAAGLHARPCHAIVSLTREFQCTLRVASGGVEVNGRSILELMTLCASMGSELTLAAEGGDAEALLAALVSLIESGFGETS